MMKTLMFMSLALVLFTFTEAVDPKNFKCDKNSPTGGDVFCDDSPQVNMVHIFCGQIIKNKATGFHSHPGGTDPDCAEADDLVKPPSNDKDYAAYNTINVLNGNEWEKKGPRPTTFWPTSLSIPDVVTTIQSLYNSCKPDKKSKVCIKDYHLPSASETFDVFIALKSKKIVTAYPMATGYCNEQKPSIVEICEYESKKEKKEKKENEEL